VLIQSTVVIIDGMAVSRAVSVDVSDLVMAGGGAVIGVVASKAVVIGALFARRRF